MNPLKKQIAASIIFIFGLTLQVAATARPNFLVIFTDDQTYRAIGYNNPVVKTPHLNELASEGLIFNRAYVASPICAASRAAMMSGVFPLRNGVVGLGQKAFRKYHKGGARADQTLAVQLQKAGYHCAFWGKSHIGDPKRYGFSEGQELNDYTDDATFKEAGKFLTRMATDTKPFFLWIGVRQPHVPLNPKQSWLDLYDENSFELEPNFRKFPLDETINNQGTPRQLLYRGSDYTNNWRNVPVGPPRNEETVRLFMKAYYATISHMDDQIGKLIEHLETTKLSENTVIVFLSDNGFHLGNHGLGNKITMHEESVRVPMFIHWSRLQAKGKKSDALVSSLDVYPTLLELAGLECPKYVQGKSLVPVMDDPETELRDVVFSECVGVGGRAGEGHRMARSGEWKYVLSMADEEFLFHEGNDPYELNNLVRSSEHQDVLKKLRGKLAEWMKNNNDRHFLHGKAPTF